LLSVSRRLCATLLLTCCVLGISATPRADGKAFANEKYSGLVVDVKTGRVLYSDRADKKRFPASLTKIMTLFILFQEIEAGHLDLSSPLNVSAFASAQKPTKLGLKAGQTISVRDAMRALAVKSANDVAVVVAEAIEGSEKAFARRMTRTAHALGMKSTAFRNASGLADPRQVTTARDMAILGQAIQDSFPQHCQIFKIRTFKWGKRRYTNTNRLLGRVAGVDGIKTGYIRASGFNLVTSVRSMDRHIIAVVMGGRTAKRRDAHITDLIRRYLGKASSAGRTTPFLAAKRKSGVPLPKERPGEPAFALAAGPSPTARPDLATVNSTVEQSLPPATDRETEVWGKGAASASLPASTPGPLTGRWIDD
jgi:D-alanyl-D-alanine carboxypeptidase